MHYILQSINTGYNNEFKAGEWEFEDAITCLEEGENQNLFFSKSSQKHYMSQYQDHFILEDEEAGFCISPDPVGGSLKYCL